jgi:MFS family permease
LIGVALIDRVGRKQLQTWGFVGAAVMLGLFAWLHDAAMATPAVGMLLFGLYSLMITAGPGSVAGAGILGVELSPTRIRTIGQSITVVGGRIGASISVFLFPPLFGVLGETGVIWLLAGVSVAGAICTMLRIPETAGRSLEEINADAETDLAAVGAD